MTPTRLSICAAALVLLSAASRGAEPAYVTSTVNLRAGAGTDNEIVAKIPAGSLVDATNCTDWCEVEWQGKKGFAIATALDRSGRDAGAPHRDDARGPPPRAGRLYRGGRATSEIARRWSTMAGHRPYYYGYRLWLRGYGRWGYGDHGAVTGRLSAPVESEHDCTAANLRGSS